MIVDHKLRLRLRWGHNASRDITVPVEYRKGSYSGRYELYIDGVHIGWVVRYDGQSARRAYTEWDGFLCAEQNDGVQREVKAATRRDSVDEVLYRLTDHARTNVLAARAEAAYADAE